MVCAISCAIALVLLTANVYCCSMGTKGQIIQELVATLSPENRARYNTISNERWRIYMTGLCLGFIISMLFILYSREYFLTGNGYRGGLLCMVGAITLSVNYLYYILTPKTDWMVLHLTTPEEKQAWLKVYRTMQFNYHAGLVLGILAVIAMGNAICELPKY